MPRDRRVPRRNPPCRARPAAPRGLTPSRTRALVAVPAGRGLDPNAWTTWAGVEVARTACEETFLGATLHECVDGEAKYSHVARVELGAASDEAVAAATEAARAGAGEGSVVGAFRCAFNIEKTGTPAGAFPAVREMQKKAKANEAEKAAAEKAEVAAAVKSGTV